MKMRTPDRIAQARHAERPYKLACRVIPMSPLQLRHCRGQIRECNGLNTVFLSWLVVIVSSETESECSIRGWLEWRQSCSFRAPEFGLCLEVVRKAIFRILSKISIPPD